MGLFTALAITIVSLVILAGIIYLSLQISNKITGARLKKLIRNEKRLDGAVKAIVHSKEGKTVKADILNASGEKFAELTVTGKSTAFTLR